MLRTTSHRVSVPSVDVEDRRFTRFAWGVLGYNVLVVLLGAVVRATGSGAGCGTDWPTCRGSLFPSDGSVETAIEFAHRATSGVALVLVAVLVWRALRSRPSGDPVRLAAIASGVLIVNEALIGAALVLFEWVAEDESVGRLVSIVVHLVNTFLLLGALALTAWLSANRAPGRPFPRHLVRMGRIAVIAFLVVAATGAITALGDTLFPPEAVGAGFWDDVGGTLIVRLRWIHPVAAVATAAYLWWFGDQIRVAVPTWSARLHVLVGLQVVAGVVNVALLAPLWMQVLHLLLADLVWITLVVAVVESLPADDRVPA